jgi:hypothetical protein
MLSRSLGPSVSCRRLFCIRTFATQFSATLPERSRACGLPPVPSVTTHDRRLVNSARGSRHA